MLPKPTLSKRLISHLSTLTTTHQPSTWVSTNHTYQNHPRLLSLEQCKSPHHLHALLAYTIISGLFTNPFIASRILLFSTSTSDLTFSTLIFSQIHHPNLFTYNTLIKALALSKTHPSSTTLSLYTKMLHRGTHPDNFTLPFLLKACGSDPDSHLGRRVHAHAFMLGFVGDPFVHTGLVTMYMDVGSVRDALKLFDEMPDRDVVSWTALISGLVDRGCYNQALEFFNAMGSHGSWSVVRPNFVTIVAAVSACAGLGSMGHAECLHAYLHKVISQEDITASNSLVNAYAKCGSIISAIKVFDCMIERDLHSWTGMIMAMASHGLGEEALGMFWRMQHVRVKPDSITFVAVLSACSHARLVDEGMRIYNSMENVYGITPEEKHCGCMVDLFSRAGLLARAYEFIMSMPVEPNLVILGALLSACRVWSNLELAELVAEKIESVCGYQGGAPVLLSNMYANQNQWHEVISIREVKRWDDGKPPGRSWIEVKGVVHEFIVEDRSHQHYAEMHLVLNGLGKLMEGIRNDPPSLRSDWSP